MDNFLKAAFNYRTTLVGAAMGSLVWLVALAPLAAFAQGERVADDPTLALLGDLDMRVLAIVAVLAGFLRQTPVPLTVALAAPLVLGSVLGGLGAIYSTANGTPYDIVIAALATGAGALVVGRVGAQAIEPRRD